MISRSKALTWMDERVKIMNEVIAGMRVIKMYTWENSFTEWITKLRKYVITLWNIVYHSMVIKTISMKIEAEAGLVDRKMMVAG